ncbi:MAG: cupin domain-containing protein [Deltaproteobacteria bacterium]|jgi:mannose-6-phosphate isomerase-like protein (cupin superfamily)|nr:cupin domain-containing protein [Deltaproteobacteria bacterium]MBT6498428.1 cupin domain-containing protein [Deltaproteobacteria bacterium]MBT6612476.1 cupin domain-containing protein [Deltaproteobacteria bacterium]MBT7152968.1 cupin domain-containing protein [Deltaproteobacteria bacterium]MBT7710111.1 cupin domain-containing protein [Deltaproteobacteria bacterium]
MAQKGVYAFKNDDAPTDKPYRVDDWVAYNLVRDIGAVKEARDFGVMIHDVKPEGIVPGKKIHTHFMQETLYMVLSGRLIISVEGTDYEMGPDTSMWIKHGIQHGFTKVLEHARVIEIATRPDIMTDAVGADKPYDEEYPQPRPLVVVDK